MYKVVDKFNGLNVTLKVVVGRVCTVSDFENLLLCEYPYLSGEEHYSMMDAFKSGNLSAIESFLNVEFVAVEDEELSDLQATYKDFKNDLWHTLVKLNMLVSNDLLTDYETHEIDNAIRHLHEAKRSLEYIATTETGRSLGLA